MKNADVTNPALLYSRMLEEYIKGDRDKDFLKKMAIAASQNGDKPGAAMAGTAYILLLNHSVANSQLSDFDIQFVNQFTKSTKRSENFHLMVGRFKRFCKGRDWRPSLHSRDDECDLSWRDGTALIRPKIRTGH